VFDVGAPGLDNIHRLELLHRVALEQAIGLTLGDRSLLVTWHPVTLEPGKTRKNFQALLNALEELDDVRLIFTKANADTQGRVINRMIDDYVAARGDTTVVHASLGQLRYLSALKHVDGVVGNSSSGIIEAPSLCTGTVNIGDRQRGRVRAASIIDCDSNEKSITAALETLLSNDFQATLRDIENPHGSGDVAEKVVEVLRTHPLTGILKKSFYDFPR
jgi:GDP/UDP-N,N'-diacetylbacillosamine 2-epimerase (hydrolysing)